MSDLDDIVSVSISASSPGVTRTGFGIPLIAAYHDLWDEREREYSSLAGMVADGFVTSDAAYQQAAVMFSQSPRVRRVKVGRRALAFSQVVRLTPETPSAGKVYSVDVDGVEASYTAGGGDNLAAVCTALAAAINAAVAGDADAIITSRGSTAGIQTITGASLNGAVGDDVMTPPRALQLVLSSHADWDATTAVVTGTNAAGDAITENFAIPNGGNATVNGTTLFKTVTQVVIPAQTGTGGTFTLGQRARASASGASTSHVEVTTTSAGTLVSFASATDTLAVEDQTPDPGIATDLAAIRLEDADWYGLVLDSNGLFEIVGAAAWAEANDVLFVAQSADTGCKDDGTTDDILSVLQDLAYGRTHCEYYPAIAVSTGWVAAGLLGNRLPADPGTDTWVYKTLRGVSVYTLTDSQKTAIHGKNGGTYTTVHGVNITQGGKVASGEWVDVVRGIDELKVAMQEAVFSLFVGDRRVPFTDAGVDLVKGTVLGVLNDRAGDDKFLSTDPAPVVSAPLVADVDAADKQARVLPDVEFTATLSGAIHAVTITGTVSP